MGQYAIRRVLLFIPTILIATVLVFALFWIVPGDAAMMILTGGEGEEGGRVTDEELQNLRTSLGLDRPVYVQYGDWLWDLVRGDLGESTWYRNLSIIDELKDRFPVTLELAVLAILMAFVAGVPLGVISAVKQDTKIDYVSRVFSLGFIAMPSFWLGILVVYGLVYATGWLPPLGYAVLWEDPLTNLEQLIFPALVLSSHAMALVARVTRSSMLEVMREDYVRTARSKGLAELIVIGRHALKNALLPVITISGYQFASLLGGVIIVEAIFVVPGIGTFLIEAITHRDFMVLQGVTVLVAVIVLSLNLIIDLTYGLLDPRIRYQ